MKGFSIFMFIWDILLVRRPYQFFVKSEESLWEDVLGY